MSRAVRSGTRADTILVVVCVAVSFLLVVSPLRVRESIASGLRRSVVAPLVSLQQRAEKSRNAFLSLDARTMQRDSVALRALSVPSLEAENDRLRQILGLAGRLKWGFVPAEAIHGRGVGEEFTLALTAGTRAGVTPFSPVVAPEGIVGMVQTVDPSVSLAILVSHPDFRASAMSADGSAFGIVQAHLGASGAERYLLELRGVPFRSALKPGAVVVTSGLGGVYPRGIPIGTVMSEIKTTEGWARTYLLRPAVMPADVNSVMIMTPQRVRNAVENVWQVTVSVDSAAKRVAAAGDSLTRAEAAREEAARRASQDSAARAGAPAMTTPPPAQPRGPVTAPGTPIPSNPARPPADVPTGSAAAQPVAPRPRPRPRPDSARRDTTRRDTTRRTPTTVPPSTPPTSPPTTPPTVPPPGAQPLEPR